MSKFPTVRIKLLGEDGNAFAIIGKACAEAKRAGVPAADIKEYQKEAMSGDYDHLLRVTMKYFEVS